jgi:hypothetical protein
MKLGFRVAMRTNGAQALSCRRAAGVARLGWSRGKAKRDADYRLAKAETDKDRRKALMPSDGCAPACSLLCI